MSARWCRAPVVASVVLAAASTHAQEIQLSGPLACAPAAIANPKASLFEWTPWIAAGATADLRATVGVGVAGTFALADVMRVFQVRIGPWVEGGTTFDDLAADGGFEELFGSSGASKIGTFGARLGAGYRSYDGTRGPDIVATVTWGAHFFPERWKDRPCGIDPKPIAMGAVARFFATYRADTDARRPEVLLGIELTPTFFIPPTWRHFQEEP